jgi:hypothetical protein
VVAPFPARSCGSKKPRWSDSFCRNYSILNSGSVAGCLDTSGCRTCRSSDIRQNSEARSHRSLAGAARSRRSMMMWSDFDVHNVRMFVVICSFICSFFNFGNSSRGKRQIRPAFAACPAGGTSCKTVECRSWCSDSTLLFLVFFWPGGLSDRLPSNMLV